MLKNIKRVVPIVFVLAALIAVSAFSVAAIASDSTGSCGNGVNWSYENGTLTVSGVGAMDPFSADGQPWKQYKSDITAVVIGEGVTSVGRCAFYGFNAITSVTLPDSLLSIGQYAFFSCKGLTTLNIPEGVEFIGQYAIRKSAITELTLLDGDGWTFADGTVSPATVPCLHLKRRLPTSWIA